MMDYIDRQIKPSTPTNGKSRYLALDALRGVAVLMVVYDHIFAVAGERMNGNPFPPVDFVRENFSVPLGIIQDFGWLGVCIFFLISGFVITKSARDESPITFAIRRVFRIFPPLAAAILLVAAIDAFGAGVRPFSEYVFGVTLLGYFTTPQIIILGVAWTLAIEVVFYILMAVVSPILKSKFAGGGVALVGVAIGLCIYFARNFGDNFFLFAATMAYIPILLFGSLIYLKLHSKLKNWLFWVLILLNYVLMLYGIKDIHSQFIKNDNSYLISVIYTIAGFLMYLNASNPPKILRFFGDISYSLYLLHGVLGFLVVNVAIRHNMSMLAPYLGFFVSTVASFVFFKFIERPAMQAGKTLTIKWTARMSQTSQVG